MTESREMSLSRLSDLLEAYGADPERWPEAERASAEQLLAESAEARRLSADALALDGMLSSVPDHVPSATLQRGVAEIPLRHPRGDAAVLGWRAVLPFRSLWASALVGALALSLGVLGGLADVGAPTDDQSVAQLDAEWQQVEELAFVDVADGETDTEGQP